MSLEEIEDFFLHPDHSTDSDETVQITAEDLLFFGGTPSVRSTRSDWTSTKKAYTHGYYRGCMDDPLRAFYHTPNDWGLILKPTLYSLLPNLEYVGFRPHNQNSKTLEPLTQTLKESDKIRPIELVLDFPHRKKVLISPNDTRMKIAWLCGLTDAIGTYTANCLSFTTREVELAQEIRNLLTSLQITCNISVNQGKSLVSLRKEELRKLQRMGLVSTRLLLPALKT